MVAFIEHIQYPKEIMKECKRVLKKDGRMIITTPMPAARRWWELLVKTGMTDEEGIENHVHYFTPDELKELLTKSGFKIEYAKNFEFGMNFIIIGKK